MSIGIGDSMRALCAPCTWAQCVKYKVGRARACGKYKHKPCMYAHISAYIKVHMRVIFYKNKKYRKK